MRFWNHSAIAFSQDASICSNNASCINTQCKEQCSNAFCMQKESAAQNDEPEKTTEPTCKCDTTTENIRRMPLKSRKSAPKLRLSIHIAPYTGTEKMEQQHQEPGMNERQSQEHYARTYTKVTEYLYLTGEKGAQNDQLIEDHQITHIINCAGYNSKNVFSTDTTEGKEGWVAAATASPTAPATTKLQYFTLCLHDHPDEHIQHHFRKMIHVIEQIRLQQPMGKILIHCKMGISRAPTIVLAYLMWLHQIPYETALLQLQERRPVVGPNIGFMTELMEWEKEMGKQRRSNREVTEGKKTK